MDNNGITAKITEADADVFPLDDAAIETLAEFDQQERQLNVARTAVLSYFLKQHKLLGNWSLSPNRRELVRQVTGGA
jgi:hypothetical protein